MKTIRCNDCHKKVAQELLVPISIDLSFVPHNLSNYDPYIYLCTSCWLKQLHMNLPVEFDNLTW